MSVDRFRFVSPGIFVNELDQSQLPRETAVAAGPAIIGRTERGPALRPVTVGSFDEFVQVFGNPIPGGSGGDVWRNGNRAAPTYAGFAAQAYLANSSPITVVRLLGDQAPDNDGTTAGTAGWAIPDANTSTGMGVYGLFIMNSASFGGQRVGGDGSVAFGSGPHVSGTLAATFYVTESANILLSGNYLASGGVGTGSAGQGQILSTVSNAGASEFKLVVASGSTTIVSSTFNFDVTSARYIRSVFNTNPQLTNTNTTTDANLQKYWLGESYERAVTDQFPGYGTDELWAILVGLGSGSSYSAGGFKMGYKLPQTPPIISQDTGPASSFDVNASGQELFTAVATDDAEWVQNNLKISIIDVKASPNPDYAPYGSFGLQVRLMGDNDTNPQIVEQFNNLNLNPNSSGYIGRVIGDKSFSWDSTLKKWREYGEYNNNSKYIRVNMNSDVAAGAVAEDLLPFGFRGVPKWRGFNFVSGSHTFLQLSVTGGQAPAAASPAVVDAKAFAVGSGSVWQLGDSSTAARPTLPLLITQNPGDQVDPALSGLTASFNFPVLPQRLSGGDGGLVDKTNAYWGFTTTKSRASLTFDPSVKDILRVRPSEFNRTSPGSDDFEERGPGFSLDDLVRDNLKADAYHSGSAFASTGRAGYAQGGVITSGSAGTKTLLGSRAHGTSMTAVSSSYKQVLSQGYDRFTVPLFGGFDGLNITEKEPFNNSRALGGEAPSTTPTDQNNAMYYTVKKAVDTIADADQITINLAAMPGITPRGLTGHLLSVCEARADALAVIDLEGGYVPAAENTDSFADRVGSVSSTVSNIKQRALNNSYGAAYYPWVMSSDTVSGQRVWLPPSIAALGTYASSERVSDLWFAPAGFNRGGLTQGSAGIPVIGVLDKLTSKQRDDLYEVNINPIASFPAEGIVVFGQKTLQATPSALDRVNVRRLLIFLKTQISRIATNVLFDPNLQVTWDRFLGQVSPLLKSVKSRYGLSEYRVVLDETTTTPDLVDRNIMYAKVFLKPTRAIEFIALDFIITRSGASFDD